MIRVVKLDNFWSLQKFDIAIVDELGRKMEPLKIWLHSNW